MPGTAVAPAPPAAPGAPAPERPPPRAPFASAAGTFAGIPAPDTVAGPAATDLPVRAVQRAPAETHGSPHPVAQQPGRATESGRAPGAGRPGPGTDARALAVQRMAEAGLSGVPATPVPAPAPHPSAGRPPGSEPDAHQRGSGGAGGAGGTDIEELARRLIEPVGRLLRAELRRDRERAGRLYGGRR
ncbi:hypothetical protein [Streptomyces sp. NRRL F-5053]|uniref:hypothetical protein n=1 Tax=Streptomyces sp. NRRL F-5053 TaxID=1463854 RepID=UPI000AAD30E4|nr:hypothetical protein [Streptomyces sp. NRRL F-5053]